MNAKRIYKRLKNGQGVETHYQLSSSKSYTIRMDPKGEEFQLHTFNFNGNAVSKEENYMDEKIRLFKDFHSMISTVEIEFPGIEINL